MKIDRIVTIYEAVDRYTGRVEKMAAATTTLAGVMRSAVVTAASMSATLGIGAGVAIGAIGASAVKAAADFEQLQKSFEFFTGSTKGAQAKIDFIRKLALPSTFTAKELGEAGLKLASLGVNMERVLPLAAKLGSVHAGGLEGIIDVFARLKSGDFPDLERLSGLGLSKIDFKKAGVKFDSGGKLLSSAADTMRALERIIEGRYGGILDKMNSTTNAKFATLKDKYEQLLIKIGTALSVYLLPALDRLSNYLSNLDKDKGFDKFLTGLAGKFTQFVALVFGVIGTLLAVLALVKLAFKDVFGAVLLGIASAVAFVGGAAATLKVGEFLKGLKTGGVSAGDPLPPKDTNPFFTGSDPNAEETARNTKRTADATEKALDLKKFSLGGGPLGELGITPVEFARRNGRDQRIQIDLGGARDSLSVALQEMAWQVLTQAKRQNAF